MGQDWDVIGMRLGRDWVLSRTGTNSGLIFLSVVKKLAKNVLKWRIEYIYSNFDTTI